MSKELEGGIVAGKKKIWTISYADDIVIMATNEEALRRMIKRLEKYLLKKMLQLNVSKTKIMIFGETRGRKHKNKKCMEWMWKKEKIEIV